MEFVGSRLGREVNDSSRVATILGAHIIGDDAKLLHHVLSGNKRIKIAGRRIGCNAIDVERTLVAEPATDRVVAKPNGIGPRATSLVGDSVAIGTPLSNDAWHQSQHVIHVSPAEWNALDLRLRDGGS